MLSWSVGVVRGPLLPTFLFRRGILQDLTVDCAEYDIRLCGKSKRYEYQWTLHVVLVK
jgi:hypothetical protein